MLEERGRLLETLQTLLDAVNHASTEQRSAIDALVVTSADLLERVGGRFAAHIESETARLAEAATHVTGSAVEVASLGEAFGSAVQLFGQTTDALNQRLQGIEAALDKSLARSDEQLAYYVAQAREVVELSMLSQQQIIGELQQLAGARALGPINERQVLGRSIMLFDRADREKLAAFGEVRTPGIADLFVAMMTEKTGQGAAA